MSDGRVYTLDAAARVSAFATAGGSAVWRTNITPEKEKSEKGYGGGIAAVELHVRVWWQKRLHRSVTPKKKKLLIQTIEEPGQRGHCEDKPMIAGQALPPWTSRRG